MKQFTSLIIIFVCAIALMPVGMAAGPLHSINTETEAVPFQAFFRLQMAANGQACITSLQWHNTEPGQASYFSEPTAEGTYCWENQLSPVTGTFTFRGDNGDAVFGTYYGPITFGVSHSGVWDGMFAITGGTGRFIGVTGSGTMRLIHSLLTSGSLGWAWTEFNGTLSSAPANFPPELITKRATSEAIALDSVTMLSAPLPVLTRHNFSKDHLTRVMLFARNITLPADTVNARVTAQAEDSQNRVYSLPVEYAGEVPGAKGVIQIVVKLPGQIKNVGDVKVSITQLGQTSNKALLKIKQ